MTKHKFAISAGALAGTLALALAYHVGRAGAYGIPTSNPLSYTGQLLTFGQPDNNTHNMSAAVYVTGSTSVACSEPAANITCVNGQFTIPLPTCVAIIHANQNLQIEVTVDGTPLGLTSLGAVPYAVEADTASNAAPGSSLGTSIATLQTQSPTSALFSTSTPVNNASIIFTGAAGSKPSFSGSVLTLPSNATSILVELWGGGGGGAGGGNGGSAAGGGTTCFGSGTTACTSPLFYATGGGGGYGVGQSGTPAGGTGSGGNFNLTGTGSSGVAGSSASANYWPGGVGGTAPRGGGGGGANSFASGIGGAAFGGGGGGGGVAGVSGTYQSGSGGGSGGYSETLISPIAGPYYFTVASGGAAGGAGTDGYSGGGGGSGGILITVNN